MAADTAVASPATADETKRQFVANGMPIPPPEVIIPPSSIRADSEKTADFIARKGEHFMKRLLDRSGHDPKFCFLLEDDPYHPYFRWYMEQCRAGAVGSTTKQDVTEKKPEKPKGPIAPPEFHFSAKMPNISANDLEIIRLTALYTAKNGEGWKRALAQREAGNFQFDFLRPQHSFYQFFTRTIDQYRILLDESAKEARLAELRHNVQDRFHILTRAKQRAEYIRYMEEERAREEKKAEEEKKEFASIDWHEFVILATVTFDELDDQTELPPPTRLNDLQSASLEQKAMMSLQPHDRRIEEAMPDEPTYYVVGGQPQYNQPQYTQPPPIQPSQPQPVHHLPPPHAIPEDYRSPAQKAHDEEEERRIREREAERERVQHAMAAAKGAGPMRIRENYVPRAAARTTNTSMSICPNCKQKVPTDEMDDHLRIELLDPRWKEQKAKAESRYGTTNLSTADVANNLKRLASQRDDVFDGVSGLPISEEELARRKRAATNYDGQPDPAKDAARMQQMQTMNVEEQLRQIRQKFAN